MKLTIYETNMHFLASTEKLKKEKSCKNKGCPKFLSMLF